MKYQKIRILLVEIASTTVIKCFFYDKDVDSNNYYLYI